MNREQEIALALAVVTGGLGGITSLVHRLYINLVDSDPDPVQLGRTK